MGKNPKNLKNCEKEHFPAKIAKLYVAIFQFVHPNFKKNEFS